MGNVQNDKEECVSQAHMEQILLKFLKSLNDFLTHSGIIRFYGIIPPNQAQQLVYDLI